MIEINLNQHKMRFEPAGEAPLAKAVLVIETWEGQPVEQIQLDGDPCRWAQWLFEFELEHNLGLKPDSKRFKQRVKQVRKALGFSYP